MSKKMVIFMSERYPVGTYHHTLWKFLKKKRKSGISMHTVDRYFFNLYPIGEELGNPVISKMKRSWLKKYVDDLWLIYARDTIRTMVGDIRHFFRWCKKKKYHKKNLAKFVKPIKRKGRRIGQIKAAPEESSRLLFSYLVKKLDHFIYRDVFGVLQINEDARWTVNDKKMLRDLFAISFLYETGSRVGELSKLGTRIMNKTTAKKLGVYQITVTGKTGDRDYYFTEHTAELWRIWEKIMPETNHALPKWGVGYEPGQLNPHGISCMVWRRGEKAGIDPFRANAFRHAKVRRSRRLVGLEIASLLVDHSDIETTRNYLNIDEDEVAKAVELTCLQGDIWSM